MATRSGRKREHLPETVANPPKRLRLGRRGAQIAAQAHLEGEMGCAPPISQDPLHPVSTSPGPLIPLSSAPAAVPASIAFANESATQNLEGFQSNQRLLESDVRALQGDVRRLAAAVSALKTVPATAAAALPGQEQLPVPTMEGGALHRTLFGARPDSIIKVNVGGKLFTTRRSTLCAVPGSFLEAMFSGRFALETDHDGVPFIDRCADHFEVILNWLRDRGTPTVSLPVDSPAFCHEVDFFGLTVAMLGEVKMFAICGQREEETLDAVECYYPLLNKWVTVTTTPLPRRRAGCTALNGQIYVVGGHNGQRQQSSVFRYDVISKEWTTLASLNKFRTALCAVGLNGRIYAIGGYNVVDTVNNVEVYNVASNVWVDVCPLQIPRLGHSAVVLSNFIYVIGGWNSSDHFNTVERYDPVLDTWTRMADLNSPRSELACAVVDGRIYAFGGYNGEKFLNSTEVYDEVANTWAYVAPMCVDRGWPACAVLAGKVFVMGGRCKPGEMLRSMEVYDPRTDRWTLSEPMNYARDGHSAVVC